MIYPSDLISNLEEIRDHSGMGCQSLHDGIDGKGRKDLNEVRAVQATVNLLDPANVPVIGVDIGGVGRSNGAAPWAVGRTRSGWTAPNTALSPTPTPSG